MPVNAAANAKALVARRKRAKESYRVIAKHLLNADLKRHISKNQFQDGLGALQFLRTRCRRVVGRYPPTRIGGRLA